LKIFSFIYKNIYQTGKEEILLRDFENTTLQTLRGFSMRISFYIKRGFKNK